MSEKKQTAAAENTAAVEKTGPVVYCGPSVKNTVKQFTVYSDGDTLPDAVKHRDPAAAVLSGKKCRTHCPAGDRERPDGRGTGQLL